MQVGLTKVLLYVTSVAGALTSPLTCLPSCCAFAISLSVHTEALCQDHPRCPGRCVYGLGLFSLEEQLENEKSNIKLFCLLKSFDTVREVR